MQRMFTFRRIALGIALLVSGLLQAQDPYLAQFYAAPVQYNPAMTGVHPGRFRVGLNYREQWGSVVDDAFRTMAGSFDIKYRVGRGDFAAFGLTAMRDQAGSSRYIRTQGMLSGAYLKQLSGSRYRTSDQYLIGGLQVGFGQHSLDFSNLWFTNQFDISTEDINTGLPSGEVSDVTSAMYLDFNAGLLWYALFDENASIYLGGSFHHLNGPEVSFLANSTQTLYRRWVAQAGGEAPLNDRLSIMPGALVMGQGPSLMALAGANLRYTDRDWKEVAIRAGAWGHVAKRTDSSGADYMIPSVVFTTVLELERILIGVSYDVNAGVLADPTNGRGAFELSFQYIHPAQRRERVNCPKL